MIYKEEELKNKFPSRNRVKAKRLIQEGEKGRFKEKLKKIGKEYSIIAFSLVLVVAGYLSYLSNYSKTSATSGEVNKMADIGDATLVNSNEIEVNDSSAIDDEENKEKKNETVSKQTDSKISEKDDKESKAEADKKEKTTALVANTNNDYFISSKMERENMYSQAIESYQKIIENPNCSAIERNDANERINEINQIKNSIMIIENLIKTKGFEDCVVLVNSNSINVIVKKQELLKEDIAKIQNIVARELSAKIENIHISNKY